jgi:phosphate transport system substrate-binding protein
LSSFPAIVEDQYLDFILFMQSRRALLKASALTLLSTPVLQVTGAASVITPTSPLKRIRGAGASMPALLYRVWAEQLRHRFVLEYFPIGSGGALQSMTQGSVDFASTEILLASTTLTKHQLIQFPVASGLVVAAANLTGFKQSAVRLSPEIIAEIYLGKIRWWRDPAILALNPGTEMPALSITPYSRAGSSGTSLAWSRYLNSHSARWRQQIGETDRPSWEYGLYAGDNHRIAAGVQKTPGAIGYMQASFASQFDLTTIQLPNTADQFISIDQTTSGRESWPLSIIVHALLPADPSTLERSRNVTAFFQEAFTSVESVTRRESFLPLSTAQLATVYQLWKDHDLEP